MRLISRSVSHLRDRSPVDIFAVGIIVHHVAGSLVSPLLEGFKLVVVCLSVLLELARLFL